MPTKRKSRLTLGRKYVRNKYRRMGAAPSLNCNMPVLISEADPGLTSGEEYQESSTDPKDQPFQNKMPKRFKKKGRLRLHSNKYWRKKPQNETEVSGEITDDVDAEKSVGITEVDSVEPGTSTAADLAYIKGLQEDIKVSCQRLEEKGHESLLITFSDDGHVVLGSENGKRFLEARNGLIDDFIHFCAESNRVVKVEKELDTSIQVTTVPVKQPTNTAASAESSAESQTTSASLEASDSVVLDNDTDDYDDSQSVDEPCPGESGAETRLRDSTSSMQKVKNENQKHEKRIAQYKSKKRRSELQNDNVKIKKMSKTKERIQKKRISKARKLAACMKDVTVVVTRMNNDKQLDIAKIEKPKKRKSLIPDDLTKLEKQMKSKSLLAGGKPKFPCNRCGFVFRFQTHLEEHNQKYPNCDSDNQLSSKQKDELILNSEVSFEDPASGEMKTKTIKETLNQTSAPFTCEICSKTFDTHFNLRRHVFPHSKLRPHKCNICTQVFSLATRLAHHTKTVHYDRPFYCTRCMNRYDTEEKLKDHMPVCTSKHFLICSVCDYTASTVDDMMTHKRTHFSASVKEGNKFSCNICGKELYSKWGVLRHKQSFHNNYFPYQCKICGKQYKVDVTYKRHLLTHGEPRYRCKLCEYRCHLSANLKNHMITHTKEKAFVCDFCGKQYRSKVLLDNHRRLHTGEKPYACDFEGCDKAFRSLMNLKQHKCIHATSCAFICDFCGKSFKVKSAWSHHRKDHTIEFRWPCPYCEEKFKSCDRYKSHVAKSHPQKIKEVENGSNIKFYPCTNCEKILIDIEDFREHMNVHTGNKPHKCRFCGKAFGSRKNMRQHEKAHTGEQRLRCGLCPKKYSDPDALKIHLKNRHYIEMDEDFELEGARIRVNATTKGSQTHVICPKKNSDPDALKSQLKNMHYIEMDEDLELEAGIEAQITTTKRSQTDVNSVVNTILKKGENELSGDRQDLFPMSQTQPAGVIMQQGSQDKPLIIDFHF